MRWQRILTLAAEFGIAGDGKYKGATEVAPNSQNCVIYSPAFIAALAIIMGRLISMINSVPAGTSTG
jgi:hypothetical protein